MKQPDRKLRQERWIKNAAGLPMAILDIPADLHRDRTFEIACSMTVRANEGATSPWHQMRVSADGELQWSRRIDTLHPAPFDGLDYRFRRTVAAGRALRVQAAVECAQARRLTLAIEAEEC